VTLEGPARFFDAIARRYDRAYGLDAAATRQRMARVLAALPKGPARVLDLGVGTGRELPALLDAGLEVTGLDLSPKMLAICARRTRPVATVEGDLWGPLPFADASFDAAIALHGTLAHPTHAEGAHAALARELARVLRPRSPFVAELPSRKWLESVDVMDTGDTRFARTAADRALHEDRVAGVSIEAVIPSDAEWIAAFAPWFDATCEPLGASETLFVATRRSD
jgi:SAM-dependent methyltransferase